MIATNPASLDDHGGRRMRVNTEGVFLEWGAELESVFGYTESDVIGRTVDLLIPPMFRAKHWQGFDRAITSGRLRRPDTVFRAAGVHKERRLVTFRSVDILDFDADGTCIGVSAVILGVGWRSYLARLSVRPCEA